MATPRRGDIVGRWLLLLSFAQTRAQIWLGYRDRCSSAAALAEKDAAVEPSPKMAAEAKSLIRTPLPPCGGVVFYHMPKTAGFSLECFLGAQPQYACCYRGTCGYCRTWKGKVAQGSAASCEHRGLLLQAEGVLGRRPPRRGDAKRDVSRVFTVPEALMQLPGDRVNATLGSLRFVTAMHLGPTDMVPHMHSGRTPLLRLAYLRDAVLPRSCRLVLATWLRHPVSQLVSAWHYARPRNVTLAAWARRQSHTLLGVRSDLFRDSQGRFGDVSTVPKHHKGAFEEFARRAVKQRVEHVVEPLLSLLDVVGHIERFDESLLLLIDLSGMQQPLACPVPGNTKACDMASGGAQGARGTRGGCYETRSEGYRREWDIVAAEATELVGWYERRLRAFDDRVRGLGESFRERAQALGRLRREHATDLVERSRLRKHTHGVRRG